MANKSSKYDAMTKEQVIDELENLKKTRLGLFWDKEKEPEKVVLDCQNQIPLVTECKEKNIDGAPDSPNHIMIEGDNYHALAVLNYTHKEKIDVIYIDPPYNTGKENEFKYNDKWVVKEDSYRHSKWLSFMEKRLQLAKELLKETGTIFISIDDNEQANLKLLCDEVFGEDNSKANFIWNHRKSSQNDIDYSLSHNYIFCYAKNIIKNKFNSLAINDEKFSNPDNDPKGEWVADPMDAPNIRPNLAYEIINPNTGQIFLPPNGRCWRFSKEKFEVALSENKIIFGRNGKSRPQYKRYKFEAEKKGTNPSTIWTDVGTATNATQELLKIFNNIKVFNTPKPISLIRKILLLSSKEDAIILDFFAGSGATGHAVMELNKEDGGNRQFIVCTNNENNIATEVCYPRLEKVMKTGYGDVAPLGGNLKYLRADEKDFVKVENIKSVNDDDKKDLTKKAGLMIALKENTLEEIEMTNYYQIFEDLQKTKKTAIYFLENKKYFGDLIKKIEKDKTELYIFSYHNIDRQLYGYLPSNINMQDIPEPILTIYKEINLGK